MSKKSKRTPINLKEYKKLTLEFAQNDILKWNIASKFLDLPWKISRVMPGLGQELGIKPGWMFIEWNGRLINKKNRDEIEKQLIAGGAGKITFLVHESEYPSELKLKKMKEFLAPDEIAFKKLDLSQLNKEVEEIDISGLNVAPEQLGLSETISMDANALREKVGRGPIVRDQRSKYQNKKNKGAKNRR